MRARQPLDRALVDRGLCKSPAEAQEMIEAGRVLVRGSVATNSARQVAPDESVIVHQGPDRFVSRGGHKLQGALDAFSVNVQGRNAVDAGSATGGFTDCLLQAGAARVLSVDVGYGQLHERLSADPRVVSLERHNIRAVTPQMANEALGQPAVDLVVADLSFTSLRPLLPVLLSLAGDSGDLILLCKPQFEVDREVASKGKGVIRRPEDRRAALEGVCGSLNESGAAIMGVVTSPLLGPAGNAEFLLHVRPTGSSAADLDAQIMLAVVGAEALGGAE